MNRKDGTAMDGPPARRRAGRGCDRIRFLERVLLILLAMTSPGGAIAASSEAGTEPAAWPADALVAADEHLFGFHPYGIAGRSPAGHKVFAFRAARYEALLNATLGGIELAPRASEAPRESVARPFDSPGSIGDPSAPRATLSFRVHVGGRAYGLRGLAPRDDQFVLQRGGRHFFHVQALEGRLHEEAPATKPPDPASDAHPLESVRARLEVFAWADRIGVRLELETDRPLTGVEVEARLASPPGVTDVQQLNDHLIWHPAERGVRSRHGMFARTTTDANAHAHADTKTGAKAGFDANARAGFGTGIALLSPSGDDAGLERDDDGAIVLRSEALDAAPDSPLRFGVVVVPDPDDVAEAAYFEMLAILFPARRGEVAVEGLSPYEGPLEVRYDPVEGAHRVILGENRDANASDLARIRLSNIFAEPRRIRLVFAKEGPMPITGMSPTLLDAAGRRTGLPVQISKNWHVSPAWFDGAVPVLVEGDSSLEGRFRLDHAWHGGAPAASHAQLCLAGWGGNQQWDQMALGSWGESVCYDPEIGLNRSRIDDVRPLMVHGMGEAPERKWSWTHNVGGGDFLVLERSAVRARPVAWRTLYANQGPSVTEVEYAGETPDGAIRCRVVARSWQSDDLFRARYSLRYDFARDLDGVTRLAFFQLGADRYNENPPGVMTRGDLEGVRETWTPEAGGKRYSRRGVPDAGPTPWFALHGTDRPASIPPADQGAWADRGLVVRRFRARLDGRETETPHHSVFGTEDGRPGAILELSPPAEFFEAASGHGTSGEVEESRAAPDARTTGRLLAGDYVEAELEMLVTPRRARDYYGPNEAFRSALASAESAGEPWRLVAREASARSWRVRAEVGEAESDAGGLVLRPEAGRRVRATLERPPEGWAGWASLTIRGARGAGCGALFVETCDGADGYGRRVVVEPVTNARVVPPKGEPAVLEPEPEAGVESNPGSERRVLSRGGWSANHGPASGARELHVALRFDDAPPECDSLLLEWIAEGDE